MVVSFDTRIGEKHGNATICVPFSTMQPVLESLASQSLFQDHRGQDPVAVAAAARTRARTRVTVETCVRFDAVALELGGDRRPAGRRHRSPRPSHRTTRDDQRRRRALQQGRDRPAREATRVPGRRRGPGARPMTLIDDLEATNDVALAVTSALEQVLGDDVILAVGVAQRQAPDRRPPARRRDPRGVAAVHRRRRRRDHADRRRAARDRARSARRRRAAHVEHVAPRSKPARPRSRGLVDADAAARPRRPRSPTDSRRPPTTASSSSTRCSQNDERVACLVIKLDDGRRVADVGRAARVPAAQRRRGRLRRAAARSRS